MKYLLQRIFVLLPATFMLPAGYAEEEAPAAPEATVRCVELEPTFITNYGIADSGQLHYVKADITVRVNTADAEGATRYHLPALRNRLVLLLARQDESTISSSMGRETIKVEALSELREVLSYEEGEEFIEDLMFTNFVVQR